MDDVKRTERLDTEVDAELIGAVREIARQQGRDVGSLVDEALTDLVAKTGGPDLRPDVMEIYQKSKLRYDKLYKKLAE
jgi:hypothetical protein